MHHVPGGLNNVSFSTFCRLDEEKKSPETIQNQNRSAPDQKSPQFSQKVWNRYGKGVGDCLRPSYSRASFQKKIRTQRHLNETNFGHNFDVRAKSS